LVDSFPGFSQNLFEKQRAATCRFSKEFREDLGNMPTKNKSGIEI
jgi:hypothetical protein